MVGKIIKLYWDVENRFARTRFFIVATAAMVLAVACWLFSFNQTNNDDADSVIPLTLNSTAASIKQESTTLSTTHYISGTIQHSFYRAGHAAGLSARQIAQLQTIFKDKINFVRDLKAGDHFSLLLNGDHNASIEAAEFSIGDRIYQAIAFTDKNGKTRYYTPQGESLEQGIWRAPLNYKYVSSKFSVSRWQPILHFYRPHYGVDYAANSGTPIKAAGNGVIIYKGDKSGYGRTIEIRHDAKYSTVYAHLSRFNNKLKSGARVVQGEIIGYVGETGLATGPHLHYEIHVNGVPKNPLTVALPNGDAIPHVDHSAFLAKASQLLAQLELHQTPKLAQQNPTPNTDNPA